MLSAVLIAMLIRVSCRTYWLRVVIYLKRSILTGPSMPEGSNGES